MGQPTFTLNHGHGIFISVTRYVLTTFVLHIEGPEYGSVKAALKGCMESVDRLAECHIAVKDRLMSVIQMRVKEWKNEHYKKSLMGGCREAKSFEDDFRKVC